MFLKLEGSWLYSTRLLKLKRLGVREPLLMIMRAWQYALNECKETAPDMTAEAIDMMEDTIGWDGADGGLVDAFRAVGVLDGDTFALWWDDGAGALVESRRRERDRKRRQRAPSKVVKKSTQSELNVSEPYESYPQGDSAPQGRTTPIVPRDNATVPWDSHGTAPQTRLDRLDRLEDTSPHACAQAPAREASAANASRVVADWRDEVRGLMGTDSDAVITIVERVADARGFGTDPLVVWQDGKTVIKAAGGLPHFGHALAQFQKKLDDGSAKTYGGAPWGWLRTVAGNGPYSSNSNQQTRKAPVPYRHQTNIDQAKKAYPPIIHLAPEDAYDVGVADW